LKRKQNITTALALCATALAVAAPVASAGSAAKEGYDESTVLGNVEETTGGGPTTPTSNPPSGPSPAVASQPAASAPAVQSVSNESDESALPFTGADLGILLALGVLLAGTGLVLRRVVHRPTA
jgi:hypothetical protein